MSKNISVTLDDYFSAFVDRKIDAGRFKSISEAVHAALRLLEQQETKLDILRETLANGEAELGRGEGVDGEMFMHALMK